MYTVTCTPHIRFKTERPERLEEPEKPEDWKDRKNRKDWKNWKNQKNRKNRKETPYSPISRRRERTSASVARKGPWASIFTVATAEAKRAASRGLSPWARR